MMTLLKDAANNARSFRRQIWRVSLAGLLALAGCGGDEFAASENSSVLFSPLRTQTAAPRVVEDPGAPAKDGIQEIQDIVAEFEAGMSAGASAPSMVSLESQFIQRGRYLDLVGIYQNMIKKHTVQAPGEGGASGSGAIEVRLARAYLRLGQTRLARETLDHMIEDNPDSPMTWFLNAAYWLPEAADSQDAAARVVANWQKALDIEPNFVGFDQPNMPSLKEQLAVLRTRTPADKIAEATAELHKLMNPGAVEKGAEAPAEAEPVEVAQIAPPPVVEAPKEVAPAVVVPPEENAPPQRIPYIMAHANMALAGGQMAQAAQLFSQVLARESDHFGAKFGLIRAGWMNPAQRPALEKSLRQLAARADLKPREQVEVGRFVYYDLKDSGLAISVWERVKKQDPAVADALGLDMLIEDAKRPVEP